MEKILLIEDDPGIADGLQFAFELADLTLMIAKNKKEAEMLLEKEHPSLVLLDVGLPDADGFQLYQEVLNKKRVPTIFLTAKDEENDVVRGLELGAEDYVTKPFSTKELLARVRRVMRRKNVQRSLEIDGLRFELDRKEVQKNGQKICLSGLERKILWLLIENCNKVVTRDMVLDCIWETTGNDVYDHTVTVYIKRIRQKLGTDIIKTIKGSGYRVDTKEQ